MPTPAKKRPSPAVLSSGTHPTSMSEELRRRVLADEATALLSSSLDADWCMRGIVELVVPRFADWCVIETIDQAGALEVRAEAVVGGRDGLAHELRARRPHDRGSPFSPCEVVRSGRGIVVEDIVAAIDDHRTRDPEDLRIKAAVGVVSALWVPIGSGEVMGVIELFSLRAERRFGLADLAVIEQIGVTLEAALRHSRLYPHHQAMLEASRGLINGVARHELLTPLAALILQLESLQRKVWDSQTGDDEVSRGLAKGLSHAKRLSDTIHQLLRAPGRVTPPQ